MVILWESGKVEKSRGQSEMVMGALNPISMCVFVHEAWHPMSARLFRAKTAHHMKILYGLQDFHHWGSCFRDAEFTILVTRITINAGIIWWKGEAYMEELIQGFLLHIITFL